MKQVKDPAVVSMVAPVTAEVWVQSLALAQWAKYLCCCCFGIGHRWAWIQSLALELHMPWFQLEKQKTEKQTKHLLLLNLRLDYLKLL